MPLWLQILGAVASLLVGLGGVAVGLGAVLERLRTLEARHGEGMKEMREGRADHEQRLRKVEFDATRSSTALEVTKARGGT